MEMIEYGLPQFPEVIEPTAECANPERWSCYDGMATEVEVIDLLAYLVRAVKPLIIVETGTYKGLCTVKLAEACRYNGFGRVFTAEPINELRRHAEALADHHDLRGFIDFTAAHGEQLIRALQRVDFAFLDSSPEGRIPELLALAPKLSPRAIVAVHDTNSRNDNWLRPQLYRAADAHGFARLQLDTPRGLTLLRKI